MSAQGDEGEQESQGRQHLIQGGAAEEDAADHEAGLERLEDGDDAGSHAEQDESPPAGGRGGGS